MFPDYPHSTKFLEHFREERCFISEMDIRRTLRRGLADIIHKDGPPFTIIFVGYPISILVCSDRVIIMINW